MNRGIKHLTVAGLAGWRQKHPDRTLALVTRFEPGKRAARRRQMFQPTRSLDWKAGYAEETRLQALALDDGLVEARPYRAKPPSRRNQSGKSDR